MEKTYTKKLDKIKSGSFFGLKRYREWESDPGPCRVSADTKACFSGSRGEDGGEEGRGEGC